MSEAPRIPLPLALLLLANGLVAALIAWRYVELRDAWTAHEAGLQAWSVLQGDSE